MIFRMLLLLLSACLIGCRHSNPVPHLSGGPSDPNVMQIGTIKAGCDLGTGMDFLIKPTLNKPAMPMQDGSHIHDAEPMKNGDMKDMQDMQHGTME